MLGILVRRLHYAWVVAAITWFTLLAAAGFRSTPGTLIVPLEHEFGWSRATISIAVSINLLLFGLFAPFAGGLMERFGVRRVVLAALLAVSAGSGLRIQGISWQWHAAHPFRNAGPCSRAGHPGVCGEPAASGRTAGA